MQFKTTITYLAILMAMASCKKEEARSIIYTINSVDSSGIYARVKGTEHNNKTTININLINIKDFSSFDVHFHEGPPASYKGYAPYTFHNIRGSQNIASPGIEQDIEMKYDNFIQFDGTCVVHPSGQSNVIAKGGIGKNAQ